MANKSSFVPTPLGGCDFIQKKQSSIPINDAQLNLILTTEEERKSKDLGEIGLSNGLLCCSQSQ